MNDKEKRIRILNLQDQYCQRCVYRINPLTDCIQCCEIGQKLDELGRALIRDERGWKMRTCEEWDDICHQAAVLYEQGMGSVAIAKKLGCATSTLSEQLKKRNLWKGQTQAEILEHSRQKWDHLCGKASDLRGQRLSYKEIAIHLGVSACTLRYQMRKRGFC
ncbi:hypothetical protein CN404_04170 [Bacillus thuringiensis]|uniref:helix-turn-helix domain-containing protein n=1 Tax=Bacillus thuringiensis TaxID=1428 RepID=UPI000BF32EED|nr:helix-turn-helix domain-containing protein [Bacillus thuringiensis]PFB55399.1 hypothetical protein CN404_04170 [Bacillus thuringiensis]